MLNELFTFPIVMIDGDNEERKAAQNRLMSRGGEDGKDDYDIVIGEAEYPYYDFIGISDAWLPRKDSFDKASRGKFDACTVRFVNVGTLLVPWTKKKFKEMLKTFAEQYEASLPPKIDANRELRVINLTPEQAKELLENKTPNNEE